MIDEKTIDELIVKLQSLKQKRFSLTTIDGQYITDPDQYVFLVPSFKINQRKAKNVNNRDVKCFSTEQSAKEYILENKPCLSFNDVIDFYKSFGVYFNTLQWEQLKTLAKSKINQHKEYV